MEGGFSDEFYNRALIDIEDKIVSMGENILSTYGLPQITRTESNVLPTYIIRETSYDAEARIGYVAETD